MVTYLRYTIYQKYIITWRSFCAGLLYLRIVSYQWYGHWDLIISILIRMPSKLCIVHCNLLLEDKKIKKKIYYVWYMNRIGHLFMTFLRCCCLTSADILICKGLFLLALRYTTGSAKQINLIYYQTANDTISIVL